MKMEIASENVKKKGEDVRAVNLISDTKKFVAQEILENRTYRNLDKVVELDKTLSK